MRPVQQRGGILAVSRIRGSTVSFPNSLLEVRALLRGVVVMRVLSGTAAQAPLQAEQSVSVGVAGRAQPPFLQKLSLGDFGVHSGYVSGQQTLSQL